ncbi:MAG: hypothetical protein ABEJ04_04770 [Halobacteriaceae archaeon]
MHVPRQRQPTLEPPSNSPGHPTRLASAAACAVAGGHLAAHPDAALAVGAAVAATAAAFLPVAALVSLVRLHGRLALR